MLALLAHVVRKEPLRVIEMEQTAAAHQAVQMQKGEVKILMTLLSDAVVVYTLLLYKIKDDRNNAIKETLQPTDHDIPRHMSNSAMY